MLKLLKINNQLNKAKIIIIMIALVINVPINEANAFWGYEDVIMLANKRSEIRQSPFLSTGGDFLISVDMAVPPKTIRTVLTAYSSTPDQTDDTPFITASNKKVRDGIIAANFLAFGTKVQIPEIFGDKVFTVEDRMAKKHGDKIDIWFSERRLAKRFGIQEANIIILD